MQNHSFEWFYINTHNCPFLFHTQFIKNFSDTTIIKMKMVIQKNTKCILVLNKKLMSKHAQYDLTFTNNRKYKNITGRCVYTHQIFQITYFCPLSWFRFYRYLSKVFTPSKVFLRTFLLPKSDISDFLTHSTSDL